MDMIFLFGGTIANHADKKAQRKRRRDAFFPDKLKKLCQRTARAHPSRNTGRGIMQVTKV
jgi:hypothetical protein